MVQILQAEIIMQHEIIMLQFKLAVKKTQVKLFRVLYRTQRNKAGVLYNQYSKK